MSIERRRHARKMIRVTVKMALEDGISINAQSVDISISGICLNSAKRVSLHAKCVLGFSLIIGGQNQLFNIPAEVMHSTFCGDDGFKIGLQFHNLNESYEKLINQFIQ